MVNVHYVYSVQESRSAPWNHFYFIQSVVEELKHDGVHYAEDAVENALVYRKRASLGIGSEDLSARE